jgi:hypothetical protein
VYLENIREEALSFSIHCVGLLTFLISATFLCRVFYVSCSHYGCSVTFSCPCCHSFRLILSPLLFRWCLNLN